MSQDEINRLAFKEEAQELLSELETALLELEEHPEDHDLIDRVFRAMHTIKGSGAMFGFDDIAAFTHEVETVFDLVRNGVMRVDRELLDLTLSARDAIAGMLAASETGDPYDEEGARQVVEKLKTLVPSGAKEEKEAGARPKAKPAGEIETFSLAEAPTTYRIRFKPRRNFFYTGSKPLGILDDLADFGSAMLFPHLESLPLLEEMDAESCYMWWDVVLTSTEPVEQIKDVFMFVEDECDLTIQRIDHDGALDEGDAYKRLGEILVERGDITAEDLNKILEEQKRLGHILSERGVVSKHTVESALQEQRVVKRQRETRTQVSKKTKEKEPAASSIRVAADKLDNLVDLVGELVIVQAQITQLVGERKDPVMATLSEQLERLSDELRDSTLGIRMLPIGTTFSKFRRLVRDLSAELGKEIDLQTEGAETELDKTVIEQLSDPLVHLLRNSIDHGVEMPEERMDKGKPRRGTILLKAMHSGGEVHIQIIDDGKGLDKDAILKKAVSRGVASPDAELGDQEVYSLIFQPGFSTADSVTNVSGRGVGMDVVKRGIESLRGSVEIVSEKDKGTTITVKLPLTLAIIDGLQVMIANEFYVIPLSLVEECIELMRDGEEKDKDQQLVNLRGEIVPYIRLRDWFQLNGDTRDIEQIVIVGVLGQRVGLVVDHVIGEHQTVIKSLGRLYKNVEGISGATIKGDGSMALILDIPKLVQRAAAMHKRQ